MLVGERVLVKLNQAAQELAVRHHDLGAVPRRVLAALEVHDALAHLLHVHVGLGERPDLGDVVLLEVLQRRGGLLERRDRLGERRLGLLLLDRDVHAVHLELLLLLGRGQALGLDLNARGGDHRDELVALFRRCLDDNLGLGELLLHRLDLGGRLDELLQAAVEPRGHVGHALAVVGERRAVVGDEVQVVLRRHVVVPPELFHELGREVAHAAVHHHHVLHDLGLGAVRQLLGGEEDGRDRRQRLLWPGVKPVDDCVVHHAREVAAARAQRLADG